MFRLKQLSSSSVFTAAHTQVSHVPVMERHQNSVYHITLLSQACTVPLKLQLFDMLIAIIHLSPSVQTAAQTCTPHGYSLLVLRITKFGRMYWCSCVPAPRSCSQLVSMLISMLLSVSAVLWITDGVLERSPECLRFGTELHRWGPRLNNTCKQTPCDAQDVEAIGSVCMYCFMR